MLYRQTGDARLMNSRPIVSESDVNRQLGQLVGRLGQAHSVLAFMCLSKVRQLTGAVYLPENGAIKQNSCPNEE